ncbi:MAG: sigma-70 family RNA polymerase sigma factor [Candidatus Angelobacter sp.]
MSASEDKADVERVLAGDVEAFQGIVLRWQRPLLNLAYRYCRDRGRAEEMAQEAFLRAFRKLSYWRHDAVFSTWLFALAANLYRSELRRIPMRTVSLDEILEPKDPRPEKPGEEEQRDRALREAVATLPGKYRDAVILFYFQDMDLDAAARSLGLSQGTVKSRLFRARKILRNKLPHLSPTSPKEALS